MTSCRLGGRKDDTMPKLHGANTCTRPAGPATHQAEPECSKPESSDRQLLDRFVQARDEDAFTMLVRRHGAMVLAACRRILENNHDAEDVFQATFIVLARKAHTLERPDLLASWLYGVAYRSARKAKALAARRSFHERQAGWRPAPAAVSADTDELRAVLQKGLEHLPKKYRVPLVLCYLKGLTNEQAARKLGWPQGSISYRLARGRELLRERLGLLQLFEHGNGELVGA
jgi:RNA polymerase sigma factor (sigma-70 family)